MRSCHSPRRYGGPRTTTACGARRRRAGDLVRLMLSLLATWFMVAGNKAHAEPALEGEVEATYLYKFAPFVDWPPRLFPSPDTPLNICVLQDDPLGPLLEQAANGQRDGTRPISVHRLAPTDSGEGCHIFYFQYDSSAGSQIAQKLRTQPVLTVTNSDKAPGSAIVAFVVENGHVRFDIDNAAASRVGLQVSSNLLALARSVVRSP